VNERKEKVIGIKKKREKNCENTLKNNKGEKFKRATLYYLNVVCRLLLLLINKKNGLKIYIFYPFDPDGSHMLVSEIKPCKSK
jgi:hypothetical protein